MILFHLAPLLHGRFEISGLWVLMVKGDRGQGAHVACKASISPLICFTVLLCLCFLFLFHFVAVSVCFCITMLLWSYSSACFHHASASSGFCLLTMNVFFVCDCLLAIPCRCRHLTVADDCLEPTYSELFKLLIYLLVTPGICREILVYLKLTHLCMMF